MKVPFTYFYNWTIHKPELYHTVMREFRDNGAENLVIESELLTQLIADPEALAFLKRDMARTGMRFFEVHGLWGAGYDLVCPSSARRPQMIEDHKRAMQYAAELGCRTYVIHIGAFESVFFQTPNEELRPNGIAVLEQLLPEAEKLGLIIAVENSFERSNTPDEVLYYIRHFNHPNVACCFDVGHANIMTSGPGKEDANYSAGLKEAWNGKIVHCDDAWEKLAPYIVTMHLHDNDGYGDQHSLPGTGTIDWKRLAEKIAALPRLLSLQSEVRTGASALWSIRKLCTTFQEIFPE